MSTQSVDRPVDTLGSPGADDESELSTNTEESSKISETKLTPEQIVEETKPFKPTSCERNYFTAASLTYLFIAVVVGIPIWWKTTEVYRASLPYSEVQLLQMMGAPIITSNIQVISFDHWLEQSELDSLAKRLAANLEASGKPVKEDARPLTFKYSVEVRSANTQESESHRHASSFADMELQLEDTRTLSEPSNGYFFLLLPNDTRLMTKTTGLVRRDVRVTYLRVVQDLNEVQQRIERLLKRVLMEQQPLHRAYLASSHGSSREWTTDSKLRRAGQPAQGYDVRLILLNLQPEKLDARWDVQRATRLYLDPFLTRLTRYINLSVRSQYLYYPDLSGVSLHFQGNGKSGAYFDEEGAARLVSGVESYLAVPTATQPSLYLVMVIPPAGYVPLRYRSSDMKSAKSPGATSFIFPRWGGFSLLDPPPRSSNVSGAERWDIPAELYMSLIIPQLKHLLALQGEWSRAGVGVDLEAVDDTQLTQWELENWLRRRSVEQFASGVATLGSLCRLVNQVSNMVIQDAVAAQAWAAAAAANEAVEQLAAGRLREAFSSSKAALVASERAFFDPSLLELLYFPEDQKFAIYVPLFLPVSLPLLLSAFSALRYLLHKYKNNKKADEKETKKAE